MRARPGSLDACWDLPARVPASIVLSAGYTTQWWMLLPRRPRVRVGVRQAKRRKRINVNPGVLQYDL